MAYPSTVKLKTCQPKLEHQENIERHHRLEPCRSADSSSQRCDFRGRVLLYVARSRSRLSLNHTRRIPKDKDCWEDC